MNSSLEYFRVLGDEVDRNWTIAGRDPHVLSHLASDALREIDVPEELGAQSILELLVDGSRLPKQRSSSDQFGQPPVVMYKRPDLEIQALIWMEGTTSIHQHGFDGAFRVIAGSSLHIPYAFDQVESLAEGHLVIGDLRPGSSDILLPGAVRPIVSGFEFIHALFHLERPSVTVVVRNRSSELPYPQYTYRLPGVGIDEQHVDDRFLMRLRGLNALHRIDRSEALRSASQIVLTQDLWSAIRTCDYWAYNFGEDVRFQELMDSLVTRAQPLAELIPAMYEEDLRRGRLLARRGMMQQAHHRLLLALIVNLPHREAIEIAIRQAYPGSDPDLLLLTWLEELSSPEYRGVSGLGLTVDQLDLLRRRLIGGGLQDALGEVASQWNPPPLLEKLFA